MKCFKCIKCYRIAKRSCQRECAFFAVASLACSLLHPSIHPSHTSFLTTGIKATVYVTKALHETLTLIKIMNTLRFRELRPFAQNHTAWKWWSRAWMKTRFCLMPIAVFSNTPTKTFLEAEERGAKERWGHGSTKYSTLKSAFSLKVHVHVRVYSTVCPCLF